MEISFIHMQILVHLYVKQGFAPGLALKLRRKAIRKISVTSSRNRKCQIITEVAHGPHDTPLMAWHIDYKR